MKMNRRRFLQLSGGAAALALVGSVAAAHQAEAESSALASGNTFEPLPRISDEEAVAMRHGRHRRQALDGMYNRCERGCTAAMFAHQY